MPFDIHNTNININVNINRLGGKHGNALSAQELAKEVKNAVHVQALSGSSNNVYSPLTACMNVYGDLYVGATQAYLSFWSHVLTK